METSSKRLEWLLRELRIGKSDLARRLNTHPNNIGNKLSRPEISGEFALEIHQMLKEENVSINLHWLLVGEGHPFSDWVNPEFERMRQENYLLKLQVEGCQRERDLALKLIERLERNHLTDN